MVINEGNLEHFKRMQHTFLMLCMLLTEKSIYQTVSKQIMLLNFYADWCRYSAALKPIFDKAADQVHSDSVSCFIHSKASYH